MRITYRAILALFFLGSCNGGSTSTQGKTANRGDDNDNYLEDSIVQKIFAIDSVRERAEYVVKKSNGQRKLSAIVYQRPSQKSTYYWIKITEDNGITHHTHFNYRINYITLEILDAEK